jgi:predicted Zn finger-like uncharacterized protein
MKITCHSCGAKYTVSDEKVQGKTVKMKCRKCGSTIVVGGAAQGDAALDDSAVAHAADGGAPEGPPPGSFLVSVTESDQRTMTLGEVVEAYNGGVITADTYVFADGMADWQALQDNESIVAALNEAAVVSQSVANGSAGYAAQPAMAAPAPQAYAAPAAAAARRDSGRKSQDLFGGGGGYGADSGAGLASASSLASQSSPGKRDENSVLFSLNALTAATAPAPRPSATTASKEDSGLIDLKALSANAPAAPAQAASAPMVDAVGMFPLGAPVLAPPPAQHAGYAVPTAAPPSGGSKLGLIIGAVIAVCAVAIVFLLVLRGDEKKPEQTSTKKEETATTATATATVSAALSATAEPSSSAIAATDESASPSGSASVATAPGKPWKGGSIPKGTAKPTSGGTTPTATGGPKTPAKGACGCAPSDLNCALKCSVGKK